ncbi:hypothetical protein O9992_04100 [Vibrio lentus]|nr:hypothetical protein [Vibrio lentus]
MNGQKKLVQTAVLFWSVNGCCKRFLPFQWHGGAILTFYKDGVEDTDIVTRVGLEYGF